VSPIIVLIALILLLLALSFLLSRFMMQRAIYDVIRRFKKANAMTSENAQFAEDLGIKRQGLFSMKLMRDYKPMALQTLMRAEVVKTTDEGKLFLHEETLMQTNLDIKKV
jgi:hypothetical protein